MKKRKASSGLHTNSIVLLSYGISIVFIIILWYFYVMLFIILYLLLSYGIAMLLFIGFCLMDFFIFFFRLSSLLCTCMLKKSRIKLTNLTSSSNKPFESTRKGIATERENGRKENETERRQVERVCSFRSACVLNSTSV